MAEIAPHHTLQHTERIQGSHSYNLFTFGVHLSYGRVNGGVERVGVCPHTVALANEVCMVRPVRVAVVYRSADLPTSPVPKEEGEYVAHV